MSEIVVNFDDIQKTLEPVFKGKSVRIVLKGEEVSISLEKSAKKVLKARGIFHDCANLDMIAGEKGAWGRAVVEKYAKNNNS